MRRDQAAHPGEAAGDLGGRNVGLNWTLNMRTGESRHLVRQLLISEQHPGESVRGDHGCRLEPRFLRLQLAAAADLPEVGRQVCRHARRWRGTIRNLLPFKLFWWESPDGSKVRLAISQIATATATSILRGWRMTWCFPPPRQRNDQHDGHVWRRRSWRRPDPGADPTRESDGGSRTASFRRWS